VSLFISITPMTAAHWPLVRSIYEAGIATGNATFQTEAPSWESWNASHLQSCRLVALSSDTVVGWAALSPVSARPVYAGVCEVSVYVAPTAQGKGVGRALLDALIACAESDGRWTLQAGIFPENESSVALHLRAGFRVLGRRERVGRLNGTWRDVLLLERRSAVVGT
jgi:L-amino acid N-acyltransferase YncA